MKDRKGFPHHGTNGIKRFPYCRVAVNIGFRKAKYLQTGIKSRARREGKDMISQPRHAANALIAAAGVYWKHCALSVCFISILSTF